MQGGGTERHGISGVERHVSDWTLFSDGEFGVANRRPLSWFRCIIVTEYSDGVLEGGVGLKKSKGRIPD